jgi:hypothetical protein
MTALQTKTIDLAAKTYAAKRRGGIEYTVPLAPMPEGKATGIRNIILNTDLRYSRLIIASQGREIEIVEGVEPLTYALCERGALITGCHLSYDLSQKIAAMLAS